MWFSPATNLRPRDMMRFDLAIERETGEVSA
jgi:hypothetical protein